MLLPNSNATVDWAGRLIRRLESLGSLRVNGGSRAQWEVRCAQLEAVHGGMEQVVSYLETHIPPIRLVSLRGFEREYLRLVKWAAEGAHGIDFMDLVRLLNHIPWGLSQESLVASLERSCNNLRVYAPYLAAHVIGSDGWVHQTAEFVLEWYRSLWVDRRGVISTGRVESMGEVNIFQLEFERWFRMRSTLLGYTENEIAKFIGDLRAIHEGKKVRKRRGAGNTYGSDRKS